MHRILSYVHKHYKTSSIGCRRSTAMMTTKIITEKIRIIIFSATCIATNYLHFAHGNVGLGAISWSIIYQGICRWSTKTICRIIAMLLELTWREWCCGVVVTNSYIHTIIIWRSNVMVISCYLAAISLLIVSSPKISTGRWIDHSKLILPLLHKVKYACYLKWYQDLN